MTCLTCPIEKYALPFPPPEPQHLFNIHQIPAELGQIAQTNQLRPDNSSHASSIQFAQTCQLGPYSLDKPAQATLLNPSSSSLPA